MHIVSLYDAYNLVTDVYIAPGQDENVDYLYNAAQSLLVDNPYGDFIEEAEAGNYNHLSDDEYTDRQSPMKSISLALFDNQANENVFKLLALAVRYMMTYSEHLDEYAERLDAERSMEGEDGSEEDEDYE